MKAPMTRIACRLKGPCKWKPSNIIDGKRTGWNPEKEKLRGRADGYGQTSRREAGQGMVSLCGTVGGGRGSEKGPTKNQVRLGQQPSVAGAIATQKQGPPTSMGIMSS